MPISEDEYDPHNLHHHVHSSYGDNSNQYHSMSKAEQRRSNKPIMEKRRRARINHCLNELKTLILDAMKKDPARHSKLEKADILEMTVKHLQTIQRQQLSTAMTTDPAVIHKFKNGFNECASEVSRYINHMEGIETGVKQRLVSHLASCVNGLQQLSPPYSSNYQGNMHNNGSPFMNNSGMGMMSQNLQVQTPSEDVNNNQASNRIQNMMTSLQLIPSRLPSGELALLLPNSQQIPGNVLPFFHSPNSVGSTSSAALQTTLPQEHMKDSHSSTKDSSNSTITSGSINTTQQQHISAFTAVCRPTSLLNEDHRKITLIRSPLPSPASSITSTSSIHYEDVINMNASTTTSDTSPNTSEISSTATSENQKNKFSTIKLTSPPVLAVKPLPLLKENNMDIENKNDCNRNNNNLTKYNNNEDSQPLLQVQKQNSIQQVPIQIPLTVITNDNINNRLSNSLTINNDARYQHPALDYSIKKDHNNETNVRTSLKRPNSGYDALNNENNGTQRNRGDVTAPPLSFSPKVLKLSSENSNKSYFYHSSNDEFSHTEEVKKSDVHYLSNFEKSNAASTSFETNNMKSNQITTPTATETSQTRNNNTTVDMWRPW